MISELIKKLQEKTDLSYDEINGVMTEILSFYQIWQTKVRLMMNY
jgi:hypothetical protein